MSTTVFPLGTRRPPRPWLRMLVVLAAVAVPVVEIWLLIQLAGLIGGWLTLLVVLLGMVLGVVLSRRQGRRAWRDLSAGVRSGQQVSGEIAHGGLILLGGLALIVPGLLTDVVGLVLLLPPTRSLLVGMLNRMAERRMRRLGLDVDVMRARMDRENTVEGEAVDPEGGADPTSGPEQAAGPGSARGRRPDRDDPIIIRGEIEE